MTTPAKSFKKINGHIDGDQSCYKMFSTVIGDGLGNDIVVMAQTKEVLYEYLYCNGLEKFSKDEFQEVVIFSAKKLIEKETE